MLAIYIDAGNNSNGNPRRGWIITNQDGEFTAFVDEGYEGKAALASSGYGNATSTPRLDVQPSVYRDAYRQSYGNIEKTIKRETKLLRTARGRRR
jgi:hypothetical protein